MGSVSCQQPLLTNQLSFSPEFGSSAWFSTQFRELSFTAVCDPWKQLWLKGVRTVPSTAPWNWHGCPNVPQNCCSGKLWPSSHSRCLIFIYTGLVTALSNASTHPAGIIVIFSPSNSSKAFRQPQNISSFVCLFLDFCLNCSIPSHEISGMRVGVTEVLLNALTGANWFVGQQLHDIHHGSDPLSEAVFIFIVQQTTSSCDFLA